MSDKKVQVKVVHREKAAGVSWLDEKGNHVTEERPGDGKGVGYIGKDGKHYEDGKVVWTPSEKEI